MKRIDPGGAIAEELEPEIAAFSSRTKTNAILADIYDVLAQINANMVAGFTRKRSSKPKRYPRPGDDSKRRIGKNGVTFNELDNWIAEKRKQRGGGANG